MWSCFAAMRLLHRHLTLALGEEGSAASDAYRQAHGLSQNLQSTFKHSHPHRPIPSTLKFLR